MKTAELTGALLDYWVARAEGWAIKSAHPYNGMLYATQERPTEWRWLDMFHPSTDWAHGGPIIERERINLEHDGCYALIDGDRDGITWRMEGQTILQAAMRAYVASKFGDELPDDRAAQAASHDTKPAPLTRCAAGRDGECGHAQCPQLRDGEPANSGRHCPLDTGSNE